MVKSSDAVGFRHGIIDLGKREGKDHGYQRPEGQGEDEDAVGAEAGGGAFDDACQEAAPGALPPS